MYTIRFSKAAEKHKKLLKQSGLEENARRLLKVISEDPYRNPPPYEALVGNLKGFLSRRINIQHRLVYEVFEEEKTVRILSMWSHYENVRSH
ncbi:MAG: Txe/YoeB family addiction module toxin [Ruminococcus sp.]|nr:Txe/YoeB family addiction module toxin [Ruminococcus sp.]